MDKETLFQGQSLENPHPIKYGVFLGGLTRASPEAFARGESRVEMGRLNSRPEGKSRRFYTAYLLSRFEQLGKEGRKNPNSRVSFLL